MAAGPSPRPAPLHAHVFVLDQPGRAVVRRAPAALPGPRRVLLARRAHHRAGDLDQVLERQRPALQVDQDRRSDHRPHLPILLTHLRTGTLGDDELGRLIERYVAAWERNDIDALVSMLAQDARIAMPPRPTWYSGREQVAAF